MELEMKKNLINWGLAGLIIGTIYSIILLIYFDNSIKNSKLNYITETIQERDHVGNKEFSFNDEKIHFEDYSSNFIYNLIENDLLNKIIFSFLFYSLIEGIINANVKKEPSGNLISKLLWSKKFERIRQLSENQVSLKKRKIGYFFLGIGCSSISGLVINYFT